MPFEKFEDADAIDNERRTAIAKSIRIISVEELKKLGEEVFGSPDRPWRQTFLSLIAENPGGTFHHTVTSEGVVFLYYVHENVCLQYHDASPLRTGLMVRRVSFHFRDRSASALMRVRLGGAFLLKKILQNRCAFILENTGSYFAM